MPNLNQELEFVTFEGEQTQAVLTSFKNKQGETMNLNSKPNNGNRKLTAKFTTTKNNQQKVICLKGQNLRTLIALKNAKSKGVTSLQAGDLKLLRLSSYVHILRHEHNINIVTIREGESRIARYVLVDSIEVLQISNSESGGAK